MAGRRGFQSRPNMKEITLSETRRPSLADQVYDQLLATILEEKYPVQSRLPAEDVLAQNFGVSRPIVRAALSRLRDDGIVQSRRGSGSYVLRRPDRQLISFIPLESVSGVQRCYEFRIDVEGAAAAWAARRRDEDDLAAMDQLTFKTVDTRRFPSFALARQALLEGGSASAVLNAANEVAVAAFLHEKIGFAQISAIVETVLCQSANLPIDHLDAVMEIDTDSRQLAAEAVTKNRTYLS